MGSIPVHFAWSRATSTEVPIRGCHFHRTPRLLTFCFSVEANGSPHSAARRVLSGYAYGYGVGFKLGLHWSPTSLPLV